MARLDNNNLEGNSHSLIADKPGIYLSDGGKSQEKKEGI
jgi:hypothetical protein